MTTEPFFALDAKKPAPVKMTLNGRTASSMDNQLLIKGLGIWYAFISLPALGIAGVAYYRRFRTTGGMLFGSGAVAAAVGAIFNKLFPWQSLLAEAQYILPGWAHVAMSIALGIHLLGLNTMVIGLLMITFGSRESRV